MAEQANNLAHIPQNFDLELYAEHRLQKVGFVWCVITSCPLPSLSQHLEALLKHLHQLVTKHIDSSVRSGVVVEMILALSPDRHLMSLPRRSDISVMLTSVFILQLYVI